MDCEILRFFLNQIDEKQNKYIQKYEKYDRNLLTHATLHDVSRANSHSLHPAAHYNKISQMESNVYRIRNEKREIDVPNSTMSNKLLFFFSFRDKMRVRSPIK